jgi:hypothetical protein
MPYKDKEAEKARRRKYYLEHREEILARSKEYCASNREKICARMKIYNASRREEQKAYMLAHKEERAIKAKIYRETHRDELLQKRREKREETNKKERETKLLLRNEVLDYYGGVCQCCGESTKEFLCIDHINGGGNKHKQITKGSLYRWLKKNNFPEGFQTLCHNCNQAKHIYGVCPHKRVPQ